jgi:hypothetical protein
MSIVPRAGNLANLFVVTATPTKSVRLDKHASVLAAW